MGVNLLALGAGGFGSRQEAVARQADMKKSDKAMGTKEFLTALSKTPLSPFLCLNRAVQPAPPDCRADPKSHRQGVR
jgi:hypothetical protein